MTGRGSRGLARGAGLLAAALLAVAVCGPLGWWQWSRAHERSAVLVAEPAAPIAEVLAPASAPEDAVGANVTVAGTWAEGTALAYGREVAGVPAVLLIREFFVDADATGIGEPATLAVLVGWRPAGATGVPSDLSGKRAVLDGYLRTSEAPTPGDAALPDAVPGDGLAVSAVSAAELAQVWPSPLYAAVAVADDGTGQWNPMPAREPASQLNLQSAAYAIEWWLFGGFAVVIAVRAMRDNGRGENEEDE